MCCIFIEMMSLFMRDFMKNGHGLKAWTLIFYFFGPVSDEGDPSSCIFGYIVPPHFSRSAATRATVTYFEKICNVIIK